jgi:hypothetical protein
MWTIIAILTTLSLPAAVARAEIVNGLIETGVLLDTEWLDDPNNIRHDLGFSSYSELGLDMALINTPIVTSEGYGGFAAAHAQTTSGSPIDSASRFEGLGAVVGARNSSTGLIGVGASVTMTAIDQLTITVSQGSLPGRVVVVFLTFL